MILRKAIEDRSYRRALLGMAKTFQTKDNIALSVNGLSKYYSANEAFSLRRSRTAAVDNVSFSIQSQEVFALVGSSGAGKSTIGRVVLGLIKADSGSISFFGQPVDLILKENPVWFRQRCQAIFQDPKAALSPRMKVSDLMSEPLLSCKELSPTAKRKRLNECIAQVGLQKEHLDRYPHQLSGGEAQRICIARAIIRKPLFIVCDEPTSNLDLSTEWEIIELLKTLKTETSLTLLFITHNLSVVRRLADTVGIMHQGRLMEVIPVDNFVSKCQYQAILPPQKMVASDHSSMYIHDS